MRQVASTGELPYAPATDSWALLAYGSLTVVSEYGPMASVKEAPLTDF